MHDRADVVGQADSADNRDTVNISGDGRVPAPVMGRRCFLGLAAALTGLAGLRALFGPGPSRNDTGAGGTGGRRKGNVADVTARYWVGGDRLAG